MMSLIMEMTKKMNKPNNQKPAPYVVFGANDGNSANKALLGFKSESMSGYELHICEYNGKCMVGENGEIKKDEITGEYFTIYFAKRESLHSMMRVLQQLDSMWVDEIFNSTKLKEEAPVVRDAMRKLCKNLTPQAQSRFMDILNETME